MGTLLIKSYLINEDLMIAAVYLQYPSVSVAYCDGFLNTLAFAYVFFVPFLASFPALV